MYFLDVPKFEKIFNFCGGTIGTSISEVQTNCLKATGLGCVNVCSGQSVLRIRWGENGWIYFCFKSANISNA